MMFTGTLIISLVGRHINLGTRLLATGLTVTIFLPLLPYYLADSLPATYTAISLISLAVAVSQSTCYGVAGCFGGEFMIYLESGKGIGGVGIVMTRMFLKAYDESGDNTYASGAYASGTYVRDTLASDTPASDITAGNTTGASDGSSVLDEIDGAMVTSTRTFFLFATIVMILGNVACLILFKHAWSKAKLEEYYSMPLKYSTNPFSDNVLKTPLGTPRGSPETSPIMQTGTQVQRRAEYSPQLARPKKRKYAKKSRRGIATTILAPAFAVFMTFACALAVFPGIVNSMSSTNLRLGSWYPIITVFFYNIGDLVGKGLPGFYQPFKGNGVVSLLFLQFLCVSLVIAEKLYDRDIHESVGIDFLGVLGNDFVKIATVLLLGISTGFSGTCCMIVAPSMVKKFFREWAAQMMSLCLITGLFAGSVSGVLIEREMQAQAHAHPQV
jgi:hypothetical protein